MGDCKPWSSLYVLFRILSKNSVEGQIMLFHPAIDKDLATVRLGQEIVEQIHMTDTFSDHSI